MTYFILAAFIRILADSGLRGLQVEGADIIFASHEDKGFWSFAKLIRRGEISLHDCQLIIALIGRADLTDESIIPAIEDFSAACGRQNGSLALVVAGPIPRAQDCRKMVGQCVLAGRKVRQLCKTIPRLEFSKVATEFYSKAGIISKMYLQDGISLVASQVIAANVLAKLKCPAVSKIINK